MSTRIDADNATLTHRQNLVDVERSLKHDLGIHDITLTMDDVPIRPYVSHEHRVLTLGRYLRGLKFGRPPCDEERELVLQYIRAEMLPGEMEQLSQLHNQGPVFDGDIISPAARDTLIKLGLAVRAVVRGHQGYTVATYNGWTVLRGVGVHEHYEQMFFRDPDSLSDQERYEMLAIWERETQVAAERAEAYAALVGKKSGPIRNLVRLSESETRELRRIVRKLVAELAAARHALGLVDIHDSVKFLSDLLMAGKLGSDQVEDDEPDRCRARFVFKQLDRLANGETVRLETAVGSASWFLRCDLDGGHRGSHHTSAGSAIEYTWNDGDTTPLKTTKMPTPGIGMPRLG